MTKLLDKINSPQDLKKLSDNEILLLNEEIRDFLVEHVKETGGHLASNLGVVELSVALHRVFDSPKDRIIWDVGHQSYVHKLLTGRKERFSTLRKEGGLSGFTKRSESEHDVFGAGHSSTSLSAALGFCEADRICGRDNYTIAVIGDGSFTGGMIYEALNNCSENSHLIIILNENEMSISKNVGNFSKLISRLRATKKYLNFKHSVGYVARKIPLAGEQIAEFLSNTKTFIKNSLYSTNIFEQMGLFYLGPIDGNDYFSVELFLNEAKARKENIILHLKTIKGCGYPPAEDNPESYHVIARNSGKKRRCCTDGDSFSSAFGKALVDIAESDEKVCAITAAMGISTGLCEFENRFPQRFFDVGIAEEHAATFCAGLSAAGMKPVLAIYSSFLQRAYDNILHDISLQNLNCVICVDRAGFATEDGATHHGIYDVAFLSHSYNSTIYAPVTYKSLSNMLFHSLYTDGIYALRYSKDKENEKLKELFYKSESDYMSFDIKTAFCSGGSFDNAECILISYGRLISEAVRCAEILNSEKEDQAGVILLETLKPLERQAELIASVLPENPAIIIFAEEGIKSGGVGISLFDKLFEYKKVRNKALKVLAIDGELPEQGELLHLYSKCGISCEDMINTFKKYKNEN